MSRKIFFLNFYLKIVSFSTSKNKKEKEKGKRNEKKRGRVGGLEKESRIS